MKMKWHYEQRKLNELNPASYNPRRMTKSQKEQLDRSLTKFGIVEPIVINTNNTVIGGHQRLKVLKQQGIEQIDVSIPDRELTLEEEKELNLRLNKNNGEFDFDLLANNFEIEMLEDIGFTSQELKIDFETETADNTEQTIDSIFQVLTECISEEEQESVFNLLTANGFKAKIISL